MHSSLYIVLGVTADASDDEIKAAYRQRALALHPDRTGADGAPFRELQAAYEILSDPARRRAYDATTSPRPPKSHSHRPVAEPLRSHSRPRSNSRQSHARPHPWDSGVQESRDAAGSQQDAWTLS